ncbi:SRPBCC family protein [soil metagenome]
MDLTNEFEVGVPVDEAWLVLTDLERIAPCLPGAQLTEVEGDEYRGTVKVKVGPITAQYKGVARWVERDDAGHRAVLRAEGRETRGQGNANATITASLVPAGNATLVTVATDLTVTGKVAQFGRGVLADVSSKVLGQFVDRLEETVLGDAATVDGIGVDGETRETAMDVTGAAEDAEAAEAAAPPAPEQADVTADGVPTTATATADRPVVRRVDQPAAKPVDLLDAAGAPMLKRLAPVAVVVLVLWLLRRWRR